MQGEEGTQVRRRISYRFGVRHRHVGSNQTGERWRARTSCDASRCLRNEAMITSYWVTCSHHGEPLQGLYRSPGVVARQWMSLTLCSGDRSKHTSPGSKASTGFLMVFTYACILLFPEPLFCTMALTGLSRRSRNQTQEAEQGLSDDHKARIHSYARANGVPESQGTSCL